MKKKIVCLLLAVCLLATFAACGSSGTAASTAPAASASAAAGSSGDVITIGTISPNTGSLAAYGTAVTTAVDLAVGEINKAGGISGKQIKVVNADDQSDPTECLNAFNSLVSQNIGLVIGSVTSSCTSAITSVADEEKVCLLTPASTADSITDNHTYVFRACYADSFQGAIAAAYAKQKGYTDVGVVYCAADTYSKGLFDSFSSSCKTYGINVKAVESTASLDVQDYTNQFTAMVKAGVPFVYAPYYYDVIGPYVVLQARAAGYKGIIMGADGYDGTIDKIPQGSDLSAFNNVYWTNHYDPADTSDKVQSFVKAYEAKYNSTPNAISALAYDAVYMYKQAIEKAGSAEASKVHDALADTTVVYTGVTGTFSLDKTGTPKKGASIISFTSDGSKVTTKLVDVVKELPKA